MRELEKIFNKKKTENGDKAYYSTGNSLVDILFKSQYYRNNINKVSIGNSPKEQLFSMFMRDPRNGIGERDLGRALMYLSEVSPKHVVEVGRFDDLLYMGDNYENYFINELVNGNYLAKKWSPRETSGISSKIRAKKLRKKLNLTQKQYRALIKCETTESVLSRGDVVTEYNKVPSLAFLKHFKTFFAKDTDNFKMFLESVKKGEKNIKVSTTTPYDLCLNHCKGNVDDNSADIIFKQLPKVDLGSILPIVDNSFSMYDSHDSYLKARAIGHYVAKNSSYADNSVIAFSSNPRLIKMGNTYKEDMRALNSFDDISSTDLGKVMKMLRKLKTDVPDYLLILSDMEFDMGSSKSKDKTMKEFKDNGFNTKIIWWNFNTRNETCPETDEYGNIFMSGYSPQLLRFLESGFDGEEFLNKLLEEYSKTLKI